MLRVIHITGPPGAGKSTLLSALKAKITGDQALFMDTDEINDQHKIEALQDFKDKVARGDALMPQVDQPVDVHSEVENADLGSFIAEMQRSVSEKKWLVVVGLSFVGLADPAPWASYRFLIETNIPQVWKRCNLRELDTLHRHYSGIKKSVMQIPNDDFLKQWTCARYQHRGPVLVDFRDMKQHVQSYQEECQDKNYQSVSQARILQEVVTLLTGKVLDDEECFRLLLPPVSEPEPEAESGLASNMPDIVQIGRSLPSWDGIQRLMCRRYGFPIEKTKVFLLSEGTATVYTVYTRDGKPEYVFHVLAADEKQQTSDLEFLADVHTHMIRHKVLVPEWIRFSATGAAGGQLQAVEGSRPYYLERYLDGKNLPDTPRVFEKWGEELARFHVAGNTFHTKHQRSFETDWNRILISPILKACALPVLQEHPSWQMRLLVAASDLTVHYTEFVIQCHSDEYGLIHADNHYGNAMYIENQDRVALIDTEFVSLGWRALDLAETFRYTVLDVNPRGDSKDRLLGSQLWESFLQGYTSIRKLRDHEIDAIPMFAAASQLWTAQFPGRIRPDPEHTESYFKDLERLLGLMYSKPTEGRDHGVK